MIYKTVSKYCELMAGNLKQMLKEQEKKRAGLLPPLLVYLEIIFISLPTPVKAEI